MLSKIKQSTLTLAIEKVLNISIGIMGFGGAGFFLGKDGLSKSGSLLIVGAGMLLLIVCLFVHQRYID